MDRWFLGRQVLLDPERGRTGGSGRSIQLRVRLTKQQVRQSPNVETDLPVARRQSPEAAQMLVWEAYWTSILDAPTESEGDPHLRSTKMLSGLHYPLHRRAARPSSRIS